MDHLHRKSEKMVKAYKRILHRLGKDTGGNVVLQSIRILSKRTRMSQKDVFSIIVDGGGFRFLRRSSAIG